MLGRRGTKQRLEGNRTISIHARCQRYKQMQNGNLSNIVQPRVLLVFEGALGHISDDLINEFNKLASNGAWFDAWKTWHINELMAAKIWDVIKRQFIQVEIVTFAIPEDAGDEARLGLQSFLDFHNLPISGVHIMSPKRLARELAYMPDVAMVYDANPDTWAMFGRKGYALTNVNDFCRF